MDTPIGAIAFVVAVCAAVWAFGELSGRILAATIGQ